jgi:hypothetical protein
MRSITIAVGEYEGILTSCTRIKTSAADTQLSGRIPERFRRDQESLLGLRVGGAALTEIDAHHIAAFTSRAQIPSRRLGRHDRGGGGGDNDQKEEAVDQQSRGTDHDDACGNNEFLCGVVAAVLLSKRSVGSVCCFFCLVSRQ